MELIYWFLVSLSLIDMVTSNKQKARKLHKRELNKLWPNNTILYQFSPEMTKKEKAAVQYASNQYMYLSCIRFVNMNTSDGKAIMAKMKHQGSVLFKGGSKNCFAQIGFFNSQRSARCCSAETCLHELGHILGLAHEHKRKDRDNYIRVMFENIQGEFRNRMLSENTHDKSDFDFQSVMLYGPMAFSQEKKNIYQVLDPDQLYLIDYHKTLSHYDAQDINNLYNCRRQQCRYFRHKCRNDGFVVMIDGICQCFCPTGLDPATYCTKIYRPDKSWIDWPVGSYALPRAGSKCPGKKWVKQNSYHYINGFVEKGKSSHLSQFFFEGHSREVLCLFNESSSNNHWEAGSYCLMKNGPCPNKFQEGYVKIYQSNKKHRSTTYRYCCRKDGAAIKPIKLPISIPFILFMSNLYEVCQVVKDMATYIEEINYLRHRGIRTSFDGEHPNVYKWKSGLKFKYCYYVPLKQDCGSVIQLKRKARSSIITSPNFPRKYSDNLLCHWLIKSPKNSLIRLKFLKFFIEGRKKICPDYVEIRFNLIGQPGIKYCGKMPIKVIVSRKNMMMITMKTNYKFSRIGFKAIVEYVEGRSLCFNLKDHGRTYRGTVDMTKEFDKCRFWNETTNCRHHPFNSWDITRGIGNHNHCRNPGHGLQPWCYTDSHNCSRKYCDPCQIAGSYDMFPNCRKLKREDKEFCTRNVSSIKLCHKTCGHYIGAERKFKRNRKCSAPRITNGEVFYLKKKRYNVGETISIYCHQNKEWQQNASCLSNSRWNMGSMCGICPLEWTHHFGSCYRFFHEQRIYQDAEEKCKEHNSVVLAPENEREYKFMLSQIYAESSVWIGLTLSGKSWVTNDHHPQSWTNWKKGQPNLNKPHANCVAFSTLDDKKWRNVPCDWLHLNAFFCKRPAIYQIECQDLSEECSEFIKNSQHFCKKKQDFALQYCSKSCNLCHLLQGSNKKKRKENSLRQRMVLHRSQIKIPKSRKIVVIDICANHKQPSIRILHLYHFSDDTTCSQRIRMEMWLSRPDVKKYLRETEKPLSPLILMITNMTAETTIMMTSILWSQKGDENHHHQQQQQQQQSFLLGRYGFNQLQYERLLKS
ncbi:uncharacterized protein LOC128250767 isoform X3 [Octopus bimaculoides]|nr:uncharacterized protein LOC128250767 isoform X3 [Octopus bimaculoides]XP_052832594.1 uncharacterized protein LOC128250767 isoform X3 [Octopus bimaculoides]XP_052832598.1 uncharacterized protein LOC128250767 isoform X3 [Octopus bimaculoides]